MQNHDGGFASYELVRGPSWLELLNPAEVFGWSILSTTYDFLAKSNRKNYDRIRVSGMHNLCHYLSFHFPKALPQLSSRGNCVSQYTDYCIRVVHANTIVVCDSKTIQRAITYLRSIQLPEGGWVGSWGICFTYATMFALESLSLVGETYERSESARRACDFLVSKQRSDGGWGESYKVCYTVRKFGCT